MRRILISGSDGQIGRELLNLIQGYELLCVDKKSGKNLNDVAVQEEIRGFNPEVVFHLAASFDRLNEPPEFDKSNWEDNILATRNLLSCVKPKQLIFASSYLVYQKKSLPFPQALYEGSPIGSRNLCGAAKLYLESEIDFWAKREKVQISHARIFRVYSNLSHCFINHFAEMARLGACVNVWNSDGVFDFIHARDVASALYSLFDHKAWGIFNVGTGIPRSVDDVCRILGVKAVVAEDEGASEKSYAALVAIRNATGWVPKISLEEGIAEIVA